MHIDFHAVTGDLDRGATYPERVRALLEAGPILDIRMMEHWPGHMPVSGNARRIAVGDRLEECYFMAASDQSQSLVFVHRVLQRIEDYRTAIASWFRTVRIGGMLILVVPHQFLFERRFSLPSPHDPGTLRFYTPASLLMEIEEALDPFAYRLRVLFEDASGVGPDETLDHPATGGRDILVAIERIEPSPVAAELARFGHRDAPPGIFTSEPRPDMRQSPVMATRFGGDPVRRILAVKLDHRDDFRLAERAFRRLRTAFADAQIDLVCGGANADAAREMHLFNKVHAFAIFEEEAALSQPHLYRRKSEDFCRQLNDAAYDLVIDFRVFGETRFPLDLIDSRYRAGFGGRATQKPLDIVLPIGSEAKDERPLRFAQRFEAFYTNLGSNSGVALDVPALHALPAGECLIFGPYCHVPRGTYSVTMHLESRDHLVLGFDVVHTGASVLATAGVIDLQDASSAFTLDLQSDVTDLEIRLRAPGGDLPAFRFFGCTLLKEGERTAHHLSERMSLLVTLTEERLRFPAVTEEVAR